MNKNCHCGQAKEVKNEFYQLRKVKIAGQNCTTKTFLKEFPMHTRGVFLVVVNNEHCVVFDASRQPEYNPNYSVYLNYMVDTHSLPNNIIETLTLCRQCIIDPSFMVPINFNYDYHQEGTDSTEVVKKLRRILGYKSVNQVYQLYSKNSRFHAVPGAPPDERTLLGGMGL